jgi:putative acyl-CoA dehydrogenase
MPSSPYAAINQSTDLQNSVDLQSHPALAEGLEREGGSWCRPELDAFCARLGTPEVARWADQANRFGPELKTFDRFGHRIDEVEFHPAYHELMRLGVEAKVHSLPWLELRAGAQVARTAFEYSLSQIEAGVCCPMSMTFAIVPALKRQPELAKAWIPKLTAPHYDFGMRPMATKRGCIAGMAMTEKQGGSDVRANISRAEPTDQEGMYRLFGHKWFCSAPMSDVFLVLAQAPGGLTCFLFPRVLEDGTLNDLRLQRLKNKLGNRANASSEIEFHGTIAFRVGEEGRGVATIIEMVHHTRLDCVVSSASLMRAALVQAIHHTSERSAFGKLLIEQPLMGSVLADLALESEAATALMLRLARGYDSQQPSEALFVRLATAVAKFWVCKRSPGVVGEALECLGGNGYVEESVMPRLYREAPLPSIWEGSGNVICLDVLRAMTKSPESLPLFLDELNLARGVNVHYDRHLQSLIVNLQNSADFERRARRLVESMALGLQAGLLLRHSPVGEAFCAARLAPEAGLVYGTAAVDPVPVLQRAFPR